jgi:hypothetical protein
MAEPNTKVSGRLETANAGLAVYASDGTITIPREEMT